MHFENIDFSVKKGVRFKLSSYNSVSEITELPTTF